MFNFTANYDVQKMRKEERMEREKYRRGCWVNWSAKAGNRKNRKGIKIQLVESKGNLAFIIFIADFICFKDSDILY